MALPAEAQKPLAHGIVLSKEKDDCLHCMNVRRLVLPDNMLCLSCEIQRRKQPGS